jgi:hypothetical protein
MLGLYDVLLVKEAHNNDKIIYLQFRHHDFIFRLLSPKEYSQCKMLTSNKEELHDAICQLTLLYPDDVSFSTLPFAGLSDFAAEQIIERSMIFEDKKVLDKFEQAKNKLNKFLPQCMLFVKAAFPEYTLEQIEDWSYEKLMEYTAKAEFILKLKGSEYVIEYEDVDEEKPTITDDELRKKGIDPMMYYSNEIVLKKPLVDYPVILGSDWRNKELSDRVGEQILRRQFIK